MKLTIRIHRTLAVTALPLIACLLSAQGLPLFGAEARGSAYGGNWGESQPASAHGAFRDWANQYLSTSNQVSKARMRPEGLALAKQRRAAFVELMKSDPQQALESSVPAAILRQLPAEIAAEMEIRVSGIGDFSVVCALQAVGGPAEEPIQRVVRLNDREYRAQVYGRRIRQTTKHGIPLHGVALDGILALHETALLELEPDEALPADKPILDLRNANEKLAGAGTTALAELDGRIYRFASPERLCGAERRLEAAEAGIGPNPSQSTAAVLESGVQNGTGAGAPSAATPESPYSEGRKSVLIIRVDFTDLPGDPQWGTCSASYVQNLADTQINPYYQQSSYGITSLTNTVTSQLYRMPQSAANYATNFGSWQLHIDARAAAAADYNVDAYDRIIVLFSWLGSFPDSTITYGGMAEVGGPYIWVNGEFDFRVVAHELGHTYGLLHGNLWQVNDGNPISASGSSTEYGDDFDTMGANFANDLRTDFNPWFKNQFNWIHTNQVQVVTASGTYRINRFDNGLGAGALALEIVKDSTRNYWIGCRRSFTNNNSMQHGAYIVWGYDFNQHSDLLDTATPGANDQDAALAIGAVLNDTEAHVTIRPVSEGGTAPNEYLDVQVAFGSSPQMVPMITMQPASQAVTVGQSATITTTASGIPAPGYQWQRQAAGSAKWRNISDGSTYVGTMSWTLTVLGTTTAMSGDRFRCVASNGLKPDAASTAATLTVNLPPSPPANDNFAAGQRQLRRRDFHQWNDSPAQWLERVR